MPRTNPRQDATSPPKEEVSVGAPLTEVELRFIDEYLIDRDPHLAALRTGIARINVKKRVIALMGDSRIVRAIQLRTDTADLDKMISPQRIMAGFIDVAFDRAAPAAARNTALRELAAMKKMYGENDDRKGSGVMLVPGSASLSDWEAAAQAAQAALKEEVRK